MKITHRSTAIMLATGLFVAGTLFTSCKKEEKEPEPEPTPAPPPPTNSQKLTGKNFKMTAYTVDPAIGGITDVYAQIPDCSKDDLYRFESNGTAKFDEGGTKCNSTDVQTETGTWTWNTNETVLSYTFDGVTESYTVITNDGTILKVSFVENDGGVNYTNYLTFTKQ